MRPVHRGPPAAKGEGPPTAQELLALLPAMRTTARRMGIGDEAEVRDVADEALCRAWERAYAFRGFLGKRDLSLRAWVCAITRHVASERLRAQKAEFLAIERLRHWHNPFDPGPEPPIEAQSTLLYALRLLKPRLQTTAIVLAFLHDMPATARHLGVKLSTAHARMQIVRRKLRRLR